MIAAVMKQREEPGVAVSCRILEVRDTDVSCSVSLSLSPIASEPCADCDGQDDGPWASAGAEFPGPAADTQDQTRGGGPG